MINTTARLVTAFALLAPLAPAFAADSVKQRIARVENGLMGATSIKGRPQSPVSIAQRMAALHVPGASVAVINNGAIEWARGYGVAEAGGKRAVGTQTLFQAASISKPVTAFGALHLAEQGKLALDEDVNKKLSTWKVPAGAQTAESPVTMRNLLNHSAGTTASGFRGYAAGEPVPTLLEVLDGVKPANSEPVRVAAKPGAQWDYSGGGFCIAQLVMTSVSGKRFAPLMTDIVLKPLGMKHSTFAQPLPPALYGAAASGHDESGQPVKGKWHTYPEQAAAGLWTTPTDLARFAIDLQQASAGKSHKVISQAMATQMLTRLNGSYGLGIALGDMPGVSSFSHGGSNEGFRTRLHAITEGGQGAVVMTNGEAGSVLAGDIMRSIAAEYNWKEWRVVEKTLTQVGAQTLAQYAGSFQLGDIKLTVTQQGERLFIAPSPNGPEAMELFPSSQTDFFNLNDSMEFGFEANQAGKFDLIIKAGQPRKATRIL
jgi:CubicO group peptidase (beta-lactamase class C family)